MLFYVECKRKESMKIECRVLMDRVTLHKWYLVGKLHKRSCNDYKGSLGSLKRCVEFLNKVILVFE